MKLVETFLQKPILEEISKEKLPEGVLCRVTYPICNIGKKNANNRVYEKSVWTKVLEDQSLQEKLQNRALFGHAEHPAQTQSDLQLTSHVIHEMWIDEEKNQVFQKFDILDTPTGRIVDTLLRAECQVGCSTRAEGDVEEGEDDEGSYSKIVPGRYKYETTDFTADPSTFGVIPMDVKRNVLAEVKKVLDGKELKEGEKRFVNVILESMQCKDSKCVIEKVEKAIKEGAWPYPHTEERAKKVADLMKESFTPAEADKILHGLLGNDTLFDAINKSKDSKSVDIRPEIKNYIKQMLEMYHKDPGSFKYGFEPKALEILHSIVDEGVAEENKNTTLEDLMKQELIKVGAIVEYRKKKCKVTKIEESKLFITIPGQEGAVGIEGCKEVQVAPDGMMVILPTTDPVTSEAPEAVEPVEVPSEEGLEDLETEEEIPESKEAKSTSEVRTMKDAAKNMKRENTAKVEDEDETAETYEVRKNQEFIYAGAHHKIVDFDADMVTTVRSDLPEETRTTWSRAALENMFENPNDFDLGESKVDEDHHIPTGSRANFHDGALIADRDGNYYVIRNMDQTGLHLEPPGGGVGVPKIVSWEEADKLGLTKVSEKKAVKVENVSIKSEDDVGEGTIVYHKSDGSKWEITDIFSFSPEEVADYTVRQVGGEGESVITFEELQRNFELEESKITETEDIHAMYKAANLPAPDGKGIHTRAFHKLAIDIAKGYVKAGDTGKEALDKAYPTAMKQLGKEGAVKKAHQKESISSTAKEMTDLRIQEASVRAERDKAIELLEELENEESQLNKQNSSRVLEVKVLVSRLKKVAEKNDQLILALRGKLEEKALLAKNLQEKLSKDVGELKESITSTEKKHQKDIEVTKKKAVEEAVKNIKKEFISQFVKLRVAESGLKIDTNSQALLEGCKTLGEVDETLDEIRDIKRRGALHSEPIEGLAVVKHTDPEQSKVDKSVQLIFEGFGY